MPRFVVLEHDHPHLHWDLMLEKGEVLRTWRLASPPTAGQDIAAEAIGDHRLAYLDYEGPVSGGRGRVCRWDAGSFTWTLDTPGKVVICLEGRRLCGTVHLCRGASGEWRFGPE